MSSPTQKELEQPAKVYQVNELKSDIHNLKSSFEKELGEVNSTLKNIHDQTKGVVTYEQMTVHVDKRIDEKTKELWDFKTNSQKLGWLITALIITDIIQRLLK